jgi:hypothetical protein
MVIARIVVTLDSITMSCAQPTEHLFPSSDEDKLYQCLLNECQWVDRFGYLQKRITVEGDILTRPVIADRATANDTGWFTVLLLGEDAGATLAYAARSIFMGSPIGRINLFERHGLNFVVGTEGEVKTMITEAGVAAVLFCDIGAAMLRKGTVADVCRAIKQSGKVVVPVYTNMDESDRWASAEPSRLLDETASGEAWKITNTLNKAISLSWQLHHAKMDSPRRKLFDDMLEDFVPPRAGMMESGP